MSSSLIFLCYPASSSNKDEGRSKREDEGGGLAKLPPKISLRSSIEYFINSLPVELCPIKSSFSDLLHYFSYKYLQGDPTFLTYFIIHPVSVILT